MATSNQTKIGILVQLVLMSKLRNTNESVSMELLTVRFQVT